MSTNTNPFHFNSAAEVETVSVVTFSAMIDLSKPCRIDDYIAWGHELVTETGNLVLTFFLTSAITADVELRGQVRSLTDRIVLAILNTLPAENLRGMEEVDIQISLKPAHIQPLNIYNAELLSTRDESSTPLVVPKEAFTKLFPGFLRNWITESDGTLLWPSDAPQGSLELIRSWIDTGAVLDVPLSEFNAMAALLNNMGSVNLLQHIIRWGENRFDSVIDVVPPP
ncbi:hypothetical protein BGZ75_007785 [Mortierella antarctica]|nr:hypothetical protein BGZ75_007785 [Mortierella antarctica]